MISIDPGSKKSAIVLWRPNNSILSFFMEENERLLKTMRTIEAKRDSADWLAVEMIQSFGMPVGEEVFETCHFTGRLREVFGGPFIPVYRKEVKIHMCGSLKAKDANIRQAVIDRIGPVGTKKAPGPCHGVSGDIWSALAVGLTAMDTKLQNVFEGHTIKVTGV